ncbi:polysaccharide deacetylase family protein [bacterium]|nr:MAG: polysaccharide deacetylase family protein [bacterium]
MSRRNRLIVVFGTIIFISGYLLVSFMQRIYIVPILMYHSVTPKAKPGYRLAVTPKTFERQMRFLKQNHYRVMPLEDIISLIKEKRKIPAKTVAITFDDGYKDNFNYAFPILKRYQLPAAIFVIIQELGRPQNDRLSWSQIKEMQDSGLITIGSHTIGPEPLINIKPEEELKRQIFDSKRILEEKLGRPVNLFSYPEGRFNQQIKDLVIAAKYKGAVATTPGKKYPRDDVFILKRLRISENNANLCIFWAEVSGYYKFFLELRK